MHIDKKLLKVKRLKMQAYVPQPYLYKSNIFPILLILTIVNIHNSFDFDDWEYSQSFRKNEEIDFETCRQMAGRSFLSD